MQARPNLLAMVAQSWHNTGAVPLFPLSCRVLNKSARPPPGAGSFLFRSKMLNSTRSAALANGNPFESASMTSRIRSRRPLRSVVQVPVTKTSPLLRLARSRPARTAYYVLGTAAMAALAVTLIGPRRLERAVIKPLRGSIEPQAEKLWSDSKPLRDQIAGLFGSATPSGRERLVRNFQSWIGHFHAT